MFYSIVVGGTFNDVTMEQLVIVDNAGDTKTSFGNIELRGLSDDSRESVPQVVQYVILALILLVLTGSIYAIAKKR